MKTRLVGTLGTLSLLFASVLYAQDAIATKGSTNELLPQSTPIPKHLVYTHFLHMVNDLDKKATDAGNQDQYKFAEPFSRSGMENTDLDVIRKHAKSFAKDLDKHEQRAKKLITDYRARAQAAAQQGLAIPPLPIELHQLQAERTALTISHMLDLQAELGKEKTRRLEGYFEREVTPRVSLKVLAHPPTDPKVP